jgi:hypothetical protein
VGTDDGREARQRAVDHGAQFFGIQMAAQFGGSDEVQEQDADLLDDRLLRSGRPWLTQADERLQAGADRTDRGLEDRFTEERTLCLQRLEGRPGVAGPLLGSRHPSWSETTGLRQRHAMATGRKIILASMSSRGQATLG